MLENFLTDDEEAWNTRDMSIAVTEQLSNSVDLMKMRTKGNYVFRKKHWKFLLCIIKKSELGEFDNHLTC